jgi:hypothetical protein
MTGPVTAIWLTAGPGLDPQSLCVVWDCRNHLQSAERNEGVPGPSANGSTDKAVYTRICTLYPPLVYQGDGPIILFVL